jgi:hypothetical protein
VVRVVVQKTGINLKEYSQAFTDRKQSDEAINKIET